MSSEEHSPPPDDYYILSLSDALCSGRDHVSVTKAAGHQVEDRLSELTGDPECINIVLTSAQADKLKDLIAGP